MSVSTEVQRTLVKSPPELWTELSNPEALARHLGDFGEIRIVKTEPETKVEWEADEASGVVQLKQSGWGTKVTLSVTRTPSIPEQPPAPACTRTEELTVAAEPEPEPVAVAEPQLASTVEPEPVPVEQESVPIEEPVTAEPEQLGFFARLFRKRKVKHIPVVEPEPEVEIEVVALAAPEPVYPDPPAQLEASEPAEDLAAELESLEEQIAAESTELLTGVLDRLGAAHHRPFSRG